MVEDRLQQPPNVSWLPSSIWPHLQLLIALFYGRLQVKVAVLVSFRQAFVYLSRQPVLPFLYISI